MRLLPTLFFGLLLGLPLRGGWAAEVPVDYLREIKPILASRCYGCHSARKHEHELRLDAAALLKKGGTSGTAIEPGKSDESLLIDAVTGAVGVSRMPPEGEPLTPRQIALLKKWIDQGAISPADEPIPLKPTQHWSYLPPRRAALPPVKEAAWSAHPVDAFLAAEHEKHGLQHAPPADKPTLLRRVYIDLIGLPPTPAELHEFLADSSPRAYEHVVDRLLASPRYGERWGRHWMDIWRYSDWDGFGNQIRESQPHIWRWRDWIIDSVNADKPYDQMILEMLAGDEVAPEDPNVIRATGFLVRNWYKFNRNVWLDYSVEHTGKAFLGTTFNCSRCHHHMYDPIEQEEYYGLRAIFEPHEIRTDPVPGQPDTNKDGLVRVFDQKPDASTFVFRRGNEKEPLKDHPVSPGIPEMFARFGRFQMEPVKLSIAAYYPGFQPARQAAFRQEAAAAITAARQEVTAATHEVGRAQQALQEFLAQRLPPPEPFAATPEAELRAAAEMADLKLQIAEKRWIVALASETSLQARIVAEQARLAQPVPANKKELALAAGRAERELALHQSALDLLQAERGVRNAQWEGKKPAAVEMARKKVTEARQHHQAAKSAVHQPTETYATLGPVYPATSSGRRTAFARWITDRNNPLTARVAVNHIWLRHFGSPLVPTMFDFGHNGKPPSHPALLDWLAVEFMEHGWSTRHLHRLLVTSQAYRMQSAATGVLSRNKSLDTDNRFLWRMNPRRLEAEAVRDSLLSLTGQLDLTLHGPDIDQTVGLKNFRRSLYFRSAKEKKMLFLTMFDSPNVTDCYRRTETVVPQQALALTNSTLALEQSRRLAASLSQEVANSAGSNAAAHFVQRAFLQILNRSPSTEEQRECTAYLREAAREFTQPAELTKFNGPIETTIAPSSDPRQRAREGLVLVLLNHNDFVTVR